MSTPLTNNIDGPAGNLRTVLSIAGSDPSGGAGIQADIKTFNSIGVYGAAAVTCLTAQNTLGVRSWLPVDPLFVRTQIETVLGDLNVSHIKIGMVGAGETARAIGECLAGFTGEIICDPIIMASDGHMLLGREDLPEFISHVLAKSTVITPNLPELQQISGISCGKKDDALKAGRDILGRFPKLRLVIITGGHLEDENGLVSDYLLRRGRRPDDIDCAVHSHPRIETGNTHGTGCTFSSAFTAFHLLTGDDETAFHKTAAFMDRLIECSAHCKIGRGRGPLVHYLVSVQK